MPPKVPKTEDSKLQIEIPSDLPELKSPILSPRITRQTAVEMDLNILLKFVKPYDGSREQLNSFLNNCNNAYELATEPQKSILFKYILCQLTGKAETACSIKEFTSWEQLKEFLKTQFSERKHYTHLLTDLQEAKQTSSENVGQFALRMETHLSQLLTEISLSNYKVKEIPGRTAAMEDLTLHHFLMGLNPRVSNIVRCRMPKSFNEAVNLAISEERILETLYKRNHSSHQDKQAKENQFKSKASAQSSSKIAQKSSSQPSTSGSNPKHDPHLSCRYCKEVGHDINNCQKRQKRYPNPQSQKDSSRSSGFQPVPNPSQVNFVDDCDDSDESVCDEEGKDAGDGDLN